MVPTIALAPILLAILRDFTITRIVVASYITFFPMSAQRAEGTQERPHREGGVDGKLQLLAVAHPGETPDSCGCPFFFTGFKIAAPLSVVAEIVVELSGATDGAGYLILITQYYGPSSPACSGQR